MRIGISALLTEQGRSGLGQYVINLLGTLQQIDQQNQYVIFGLEGDRSLESISAPNFTVVRVPNVFRRPIPSILWHWTVLPILVRRWRLDLLHLPSYRRLCPLSPCPVVVTVHDLAVLRLPAKHGRLRHWYVKVIVRKLLNRSSRIMADSGSTRDDVVNFTKVNPELVTVVALGIDHKRYCPMDRAYCRAELERRYGIAAPFILCVARLEHPGKNLVRLIDAFTRLKSQTGLPHQLVLAGAPWNGAETIYQAAKESGIAEDVVFPGFIPAEDLPLFYNAADLFVVPSLHEGFGLPVLEAMACGTPVACSNASSLPEVGGDAALYFDPHDPAAIGQQVLQLLQDREMRDRCIASGLERAALFSWLETARRTAALYRASEMPGDPDMVQIFGVRFDNLSREEALERIRAFVQQGKPRAVFTPNVDFLMLGRKDPAFRDITNTADLNLCDSVPLRWASRLLGVPLKARIAGADLLPAACELAAKEGYRVYFLGGAPGVGERAAQILKARHPDLRVVGVYAPPMGFNGDQTETRKILQTIRRAAPHILFVSLGTPKQERWIHEFRKQIGVPVAIGVGASFDFVGGTRRRAPVWIQRIGLEWLFRLCQEPRRLWRRYLLRDSQFVFLVFGELLRMKTSGTSGYG